MAEKQFGYARVSTADQNPELQVRALLEAGCDEVFTDYVSGVLKTRPEFQKLMGKIREGDTLVVWKLDRLGRSTSNVMELLRDLTEKGVAFRSMTDPIDTSTANGRFMATIYAAFAEMEHALIVERTKAGLVAAAENGRKGGRPGVSVEKQNRVIELSGEPKLSAREKAALIGVGVSTYYKIVAEARRQAAHDGARLSEAALNT